MTVGDNRSNGTPTMDQLERDIAAQREQLAGSVGALQAKLDVKSRARQRFADLKDRATTDAGTPRPAVVVGAVLALAAVAGLVHLRRTH